MKKKMKIFIIANVAVVFAVVLFVKNDTSDEVGCFFSGSNEQDIIK